MHVRPETTPLVGEPSNDLVLRALVRAGDAGADVSATWVRIDGRHRRLRTDRSDRLYLVTAGAGSVTVGDSLHEVTAADVVLVPRGMPYHLEGAMTYVVVNIPGFREGDDVYLEA
jgi:mannose-6-phosphate isomerase-like protein (cupin superfamily)